MNLQIAEGILIPFVGTSLGAAMVFFLKKQLSGRIRKALTGFAAGVMVAASFWSLLQPALDNSAGMGTLAFLPAAAGFLAGVGFLLALDISHRTCIWTGRMKARGVPSNVRQS